MAVLGEEFSGRDWKTVLIRSRKSPLRFGSYPILSSGQLYTLNLVFDIITPLLVINFRC